MHDTHAEGLTLDQDRIVTTVTRNLEPRYHGTFSRETIERLVTDSLQQLLPTAKVATYLPLLTEKFTRERLQALGKAAGTLPSTVPAVLFLCVQNAGRSQMAAGWLRHLAGDAATVYSGGSGPTSTINPAAVDAMAEIGVDIVSEFPKPWTDEVVRAADAVITMGCGDACPIFPGKHYEDWDVEDPAGKELSDVRPIREQIRTHVEELMASLDIPRRDGT